MIGVVLFGDGKMGTEVSKIIEATPGMEVASESSEYESTVVMDFSYPPGHDEAAAFAGENKFPLISGTTGLSQKQFDNMRELAKQVPVLYSSNFSYGIIVMKTLLKEASALLGDWDVELVETHHNEKKDKPSGTAVTLCNTMKEVLGDREIGVHSLRGGTVPGIHQAQFFGVDEVIEIKHTAISRRIFAEGACMTIEKMAKAAPGYYSFEEIVM